MAIVARSPPLSTWSRISSARVGEALLDLGRLPGGDHLLADLGQLAVAGGGDGGDRVPDITLVGGDRVVLEADVALENGGDQRLPGGEVGNGVAVGVVAASHRRAGIVRSVRS